MTSLDQLITTNPWVSETSRWGDRRWYLEGRTPGMPQFSIHWRLDGLTESLSNEIKLLGASLLLPRKSEPSLLKFSNAPTVEVALVYLADFMAEVGYGSLTELDADAFAHFKRYLVKSSSAPFDPADEAAEGIGPEDGVDEHDHSDDVDIDAPTFNFVSLRLRPWSWLHQVRGDLERAGLAVGMAPIFNSRTATSLALELSAESLSTVEEIPDAVILPIIKEAHRLIGDPAEQMFWIQDKYLEIGPLDGTTDDKKRAKRERLVSVLNFRLEGEQRPWLKESSGVRRLPGLRIAEGVRMIRDACLTVLNAGVGWRISEALSVEVAPQEDDRLPSCIEIRPSSSGLNEHFFLKGYLSKNQREPTPTDWLIGARVIGSDAEPMTVRAVRVLERLYRPWRTAAPSEFLRKQLILNWYSSSITFDPGHIVEVRSDAVRVGSQNFIAQQVGLAEIIEPLVASDPKLLPYYQSAGRCIRPHQWRRTFHRLIFRINPDLGPAISRHFKHMSLAVTENGYIARSPAALEDSEAVATNELVRLLYERNEAHEPAIAGGDKILERHRALLGQIIQGDDLVGAGDRLRGFIGHADLRLWPAEHGSCLIGLNPDRAVCHKAHGRFDWRAISPNIEQRNPDACCSCPNFVLGKADIPFWQRRYDENRTAWERSGRSVQFRAARDRAHQARTILAHLGAPVPDEQTSQATRP